MTLVVYLIYFDALDNCIARSLHEISHQLVVVYFDILMLFLVANSIPINERLVIHW